MSEKSTNFVAAIVSYRLQPGKNAKMKRADNPATAYQAWDLLYPWLGEKFTIPDERLPYEVVGAAVARSDIQSDGSLSLGSALRHCSEKKGDELARDPVSAKLRRLLACSDKIEVCLVIRPFLSFIVSKGVSIKFASVLDDLVYFGDGTRVKTKWAADFYKGDNSDGGDATDN